MTDAYAYPLTIRELLLTGVRRAPDQQIIYADRRLTYRELDQRVARLGSALAALGVRPGHTVAVMDWDSHRYLECFFAVPMMGAVLHTVNVRLSAEQVLYTINHAPDDVILVNAEFLPLLHEIWNRVVPGKTLVLLSDDGASAATELPIAGEYEALLAAADPGYGFPALDENTRATTFYTTGTTGLPKGVYFSHRQLVLHTLAATAALAGAGQGCFNDDDVYMPITPMFHVHAWGLPYVGDHAVRQADLSRPLCARHAGQADRARESDILALRADPAGDGAGGSTTSVGRSVGLEGDHRRCGAAADGGRTRA